MSKKKHFFDKRLRKSIRSMLEEGWCAESIPMMCRIYVNGTRYEEFLALPEKAQRTLLSMEMKVYLRRHPEITKKEQKYIRKWVKSGHSVYEDFCGIRQDILTALHDFPSAFDDTIPIKDSYLCDLPSGIFDDDTLPF